MNSAGHVRIRPESGRISGRILGRILSSEQLDFFSKVPPNPAGNPAKIPAGLSGRIPASEQLAGFPIFLRQSGLQSGQFLAGFLAGFRPVSFCQIFFLLPFESRFAPKFIQTSIQHINIYIQWKSSFTSIMACQPFIKEYTFDLPIKRK